MKLIRTKLDGSNFFYKKDDRVIGARVALRKYERFESYLISHLTGDKSLAVDVGANIGYYTLKLAKSFKKVLAFEPEPTNFRLLKKNVLANNLGNVQTFQYALSDKDESLKMGLSDDNFGDHQIVTKDSERQLITIKSKPLDTVVRSRVSLLKIDTQGWEPKVVLGAKKIIIRDLPTIYLEFWPTGYRRSNQNYHKMLCFLLALYGRVHLIDDDLRLVYPVSVDTLTKRCNTSKGYVDLLFIKHLSWRNRWIFVRKFKLKSFIKRIIKL